MRKPGVQCIGSNYSKNWLFYRAILDEFSYQLDLIHGGSRGSCQAYPPFFGPSHGENDDQLCCYNQLHEAGDDL